MCSSDALLCCLLYFYSFSSRLLFLLVPSGSTSWSSRRRFQTGPQHVKRHHRGHVTLQRSTFTTWASTCFVYEPTWMGITPTGCIWNSALIKMVRDRDKMKMSVRKVGHERELVLLYVQAVYRKDILFMSPWQHGASSINQSKVVGLRHMDCVDVSKLIKYFGHCRYITQT